MYAPAQQALDAAAATQTDGKRVKKNKFGAKRVEIDGLKFSSLKEGGRYRTLKLMRDIGEISGLNTQKSYDLMVEGKKIGVYRADFVYEKDGKTHIEDVKGYRSGKSPAYLLFSLKWKIMRATHPECVFAEI